MLCVHHFIDLIVGFEQPHTVENLIKFRSFDGRGIRRTEKALYAGGFIQCKGGAFEQNAFQVPFPQQGGDILRKVTEQPHFTIIDLRSGGFFIAGIYQQNRLLSADEQITQRRYEAREVTAVSFGNNERRIRLLRQKRTQGG